MRRDSSLLDINADRAGGRTSRPPCTRLGAPVPNVPKRQADGQYRRVPPSWLVSSLDDRTNVPAYCMLVGQLLGRRTCSKSLATRATNE